MRVLVACEFSGVVREAFRRRGHDAWSCDLLPAEDGSIYHYQEDVFGLFDRWTPPWWDLMIFHWPCTNMASSGARWFAHKRTEQEQDVAAFTRLMQMNIPRVAGENPVGVLSTRYRKPDQIIQPWMFGHPESKATCLWLKGLPLLKPTHDVREEMLRLPLRQRTRVHYASPGPDRWKERSRTLLGVAEAMAEQWGGENGHP